MFNLLLTGLYFTVKKVKHFVSEVQFFGLCFASPADLSVTLELQILLDFLPSNYATIQNYK